MTPVERAAYLPQPGNAVLAATSRDGRVHAVPVRSRYVDADFQIITERGLAKHRYAARAGRCPGWPEPGGVSRPKRAALEVADVAV